MDADARLEAMAAETQRLRDRIAVLEGMLGLDLRAPLEFRLTNLEARLFGVVLQRGMASRETLMAALYYDRPTDRDEPEIKIVDVVVCKIRKKLKPFGIDLLTIWGQGYRLSPEDRERCKSMMEASIAVAA